MTLNQKQPLIGIWFKKLCHMNFIDFDKKIQENDFAWGNSLPVLECDPYSQLPPNPLFLCSL